MIIDGHTICILLHVVMNRAVKTSNKYISSDWQFKYIMIIVNMYRRLQRNLPSIIDSNSIDI